MNSERERERDAVIEAAVRYVDKRGASAISDAPLEYMDLMRTVAALASIPVEPEEEPWPDDLFRIDGGVERSNGEPFTRAEAQEFGDALLEWIDSRGCGFGGSIGLVEPEGAKPVCGECGSKVLPSIDGIHWMHVEGYGGDLHEASPETQGGRPICKCGGAGCHWCCSECNYDRHLCRGCGQPVNHGDVACAGCQGQGEAPEPAVCVKCEGTSDDPIHHPHHPFQPAEEGRDD